MQAIMKRLFYGLTIAALSLLLILFNKFPTHLDGKRFRNVYFIERINNVTSFSLTRDSHVVKSCIGDPNTNLTALILNRTIYATKSEWRRIKQRCRHFMMNGFDSGRTGNHLFQIASLIGIAYLHGYIPIIKKSHPINAFFDLPFAVDDISMHNNKVLSVPQCASYDKRTEAISHEHNWTLTGYFQTWKYFSHVEHIVRDSFRIRRRFLDEAENFMRNVSVMGVANVGLHVRRGDMLYGAESGYSVADLSFIERAMEFYRLKYDSVQFIIVSDGIEWCKEHIKSVDVLFSPFRHPISDFALLSLCDHVIVTSGTFGWWGAWLANGTTVYFNGYPKKGTNLYRQTNLTEYYPNSWIRL